MSELESWEDRTKGQECYNNGYRGGGAGQVARGSGRAGGRASDWRKEVMQKLGNRMAMAMAMIKGKGREGKGRRRASGGRWKMRIS